MMGSMEQYYIATEDGQAEGPYSFESLETFYTEGKINDDTLVCIAGDQGWMRFYALLEHERKIQAFQRGEATRKKEEEARRRFDEAQAQLNKPAWQKIHEQQDTRSSVSEPLEITIELIFQVVGIACFVLSAACLILLASTHKGEPVVNAEFAIAGAVVLILSGLGFFWCAKVSGLLSVIAKRMNTSGTSTNKQ